MASLTPAPKAQFFDANGNPLVGGKLYSYAAGTTTPLATYVDQTQTATNTNPVILDSRGEANVWLAVASYKLRLTDANNVEIWTVDNIVTDDVAVLSDLALPGGATLVGYSPGVDSLLGVVPMTVKSALDELSDKNSGSSVVGFRAAGINGTAQAGAASTITLASGSSASDDAYNGWTVEITSGTGSGQVRTISDYVGSTKVATVSTAWATPPDATSVYNITYPRTAQSKMRDVVSVLDFGADPTGGTDSTLAIQAAIDSLTTGTVFLPAGTYDCSAILLKSKVHLIGNGEDSTILQDCTITPLGENNIENITVTNTGRTQDAIKSTSAVARLRLNNLTISGADKGVNLSDSYAVAINNLKLFGNTYGIYASAAGAGTTLSLNKIWAYSNVTSGVYINNYADVNLTDVISELVTTSGASETQIFNSSQVTVHGYWAEQSSTATACIGLRLSGVSGLTLAEARFQNYAIGLNITGTLQSAILRHLRFIGMSGQSAITCPAASAITKIEVVDNDYGGAATNFTANAGNDVREISGSTTTWVNSTSSKTEIVNLFNVQRDSGGAALVAVNNTASPAANTAMAFFAGRGKNSSGAVVDYGQIRVYSNDNTALAESGYVSLFPRFGGSLVEGVRSENALFRPGSDNALTLGTASFRWTTVYATTPTINTSDEREKQQVRDITSAEREVAIKIKALIRAFKFNDAVELKGDGARIHFGVIAQEVIAAFRSEGLDPMHYAVVCYDQWGATDALIDDDGTVLSPARNAGNRYGVRYEELLAFIIAAL